MEGKCRMNIETLVPKSPENKVQKHRQVLAQGVSDHESRSVSTLALVVNSQQVSAIHSVLFATVEQSS